MKWNIIETPPATAEDNMRKDEALLTKLGEQENPILHLYSWKNPSITFGHFIKIDQIVRLNRAKKRGIDLAKRPTGGGVVFHLWDLAFSVLIPSQCPFFSKNTLTNYALINRVVQNAITDCLKSETHLIDQDAEVLSNNCVHFCMARPTKYDIVVNGKKIVGAAQRTTKDGFLHQGTIALIPPDRHILTDLLEPAICQAIEHITFPLFKDSQELDNRRALMREKLKQFFSELTP